MLPIYSGYQSSGARLITVVLLLCISAPAVAEDWSDNAIAWRYGEKFREPFNRQDISKNILSLTHASGGKYGSDFLNIDLLLSNNKDPLSTASASGAREAYVVYRHLFNIGEISGREMQFGAVRGIGMTGGFDFNDKRDLAYNSKKRMLALGPTFMMDVPGFLNVSLLALWESNHPGISTGAFNPGYPAGRYDYKLHPDFNMVWAMPVGGFPVSFEGYLDFIGSKGLDELGNNTAPETNIDMKFLYDIGRATGGAKNTFRVGIEYQYWHNKFGNSNRTVAPLGGNTASTTMIRAEFHF